MTGGVVSMNVMVWLQEALLVQSSVAVQVRRKMRTAGQVAGSSLSTKVMVTLVSQVSLAVGLPKTGTEPVTHSFVRSGSHAMTGGVVSMNVMVCTQLALLPQPSVAVQVRRMVALPVQLVPSKASLKTRLVMPLHVSVALATPVLLVV